ncbi:MAG: sulfatase-like hydrolase/transferase, partial [Bacteroidota bacterium]|nr:sulfatase-like hydrolase/transferase [Bacteroidota bacterium]
AMVASVDESVGRVLQALEAAELQDNTIVVFTSDNGGLSTLSRGRAWAPTSNLPFRAGKGWLYEGGIRIPLIVSGIHRDPTVMDVPGTTDDLLPTIASLAGLPDPIDVDGLDLFAKPAPERALYWHFPHYHGSANRPSGAVRQGRYKVIEWFETNSAELYDLDSDPGETTDISTFEPAKTQELLRKMQSWRDEVGAR